MPYLNSNFSYWKAWSGEIWVSKAFSNNRSRSSLEIWQIPEWKQETYELELSQHWKGKQGYAKLGRKAHTSHPSTENAAAGGSGVPDGSVLKQNKSERQNKMEKRVGEGVPTWPRRRLLPLAVQTGVSWSRYSKISKLVVDCNSNFINTGVHTEPHKWLMRRSVEDETILHADFQIVYVVIKPWKVWDIQIPLEGCAEWILPKNTVWKG